MTLVFGDRAREGDTDAADQSAAAYRHDDGVERGLIGEQLERDRAGAGDHVPMRVRRDEAAAAGGGMGLGLALRFVVVAARPQFGAGRADGVGLGARRIRRNEDDERDAEDAARVGERAAMVSGRRGDEPLVHGAGIGAPLHGVEGAPESCRSSSAGRLPASDERRPASPRRARPNAGAGCGRRVRSSRSAAERISSSREAHGLSEPAEARMSARFPANAERGMTSSAPACRAAAISSACTCDAKADGANAREFAVGLHGRDRRHRIHLLAVEIEDHQRRLQRPRLREDFLGRPGEDDLRVHMPGDLANLGAEQEVVDGGEDGHPDIISPRTPH